MNKIFLLTVMLFISFENFAHELVSSEPCNNCKHKINDHVFNFKPEYKLQKSGYRKLVSISINDKNYKLPYPDAFHPEDPFPLYTLDLNFDGYKDLALLIRKGIRNEYFLYFLYNQKSGAYKLLGEFPRLDVKQKKIVSIEYDGPKEIKKSYQLKNGKLIQKKGK